MKQSQTLRRVTWVHERIQMHSTPSCQEPIRALDFSFGHL